MGQSNDKISRTRRTRSRTSLSREFASTLIEESANLTRAARAEEFETLGSWLARSRSRSVSRARSTRPYCDEGRRTQGSGSKTGVDQVDDDLQDRTVDDCALARTCPARTDDRVRRTSAAARARPPAQRRISVSRITQRSPRIALELTGNAPECDWNHCWTSRLRH